MPFTSTRLMKTSSLNAQTASSQATSASGPATRQVAVAMSGLCQQADVVGLSLQVS